MSNKTDATFHDGTDEPPLPITVTWTHTGGPRPLADDEIALTREAAEFVEERLEVAARDASQAGHVLVARNHRRAAAKLRAALQQDPRA